jgi:hypothetical protein
LNFARSRSLDPRITFTRASVGTYVGRDGLIKTAGEDEARFDHDPETLESLGLLIEESRTNILGNSQNLADNNGNDWDNVNGTIAANQTTAPDGTNTAASFTTSAGNAEHSVVWSELVPTGNVTASVWVKRNTYSIVSFVLYGEPNSIVSYNVSTKTVYNQASNVSRATITEYPNGWYRISATMNCTVANSRAFRLYASTGNFDASGTESFYYWGPQVEAGSFETSYIPTYVSNTSVTRAVDVAFIPQGLFAEIYNTEESTVLMDVKANIPVSVGNQRNMFHLGNDNSDGFGFFKEGGGLNKFFHIRSGGSTLTNFDSGVDFPYQTTVKFAAAFTSGDQAMYFDDVLRTSTADTSGLNQSAITIWNIGASNSQGANPLTGTISKMVYYPKRVSNAQLLTLRNS